MSSLKVIKKNKGQTLIEVLIALSIAVAIISAITSVVISALNNSSFSKNQNMARSYAQQTMEKIRGQVQSNYSKFVATNSALSYCVDSDGNMTPNTSNCNAIKTGIFIREVNFVLPSPDCQNYLEAKVLVSWSDSKCTDTLNLYCHNVTISTCFTDINSVPSPI